MLCGFEKKVDKGLRTARLFSMFSPSVYMVRDVPNEALIKELLAVLGRDDVAELLLDPTLRPGPYWTDYQPIRVVGKSAKTEQRQDIQELGDTYRCHTCGAQQAAGEDKRRGRWIADHQPPKGLLVLDKASLFTFGGTLSPLAAALLTATSKARPIASAMAAMRDTGTRLYPHCGRCSVTQSGHVSRLNRLAEAIMMTRSTAATQAGAAKLQALYARLDTAMSEAQGRRYLRLVHVDAQSTPGSPSAASVSEKAEVQRIGGMTDEEPSPGAGCHTCDEADPRNGADWVADHQPPTTLWRLRMRRDASQYLFPQCQTCSARQSVVTARIGAIFAPMISMSRERVES
jgi:hypothetical protein